MNTKLEKPVVFEYNNYRKYLSDLYSYLKGTKGYFSYRYFSRMAGFRSPNFLKLVIDGHRNLSGESIEKFIKALKLPNAEATFFRNLVLVHQANTVEEKKYFTEQLLKSKFYKKLHPLSEIQYSYYNHWHMIPIRELAGLKTFREDPHWIANQLLPEISPSQAKTALKDLEKLGLLKKNENEKLVPTQKHVSTGDEVVSASVANYHKTMIGMGAKAIDLFPEHKRDISAVTLTLSQKGFSEIKTLIQRFRKELLEISDQDSCADTVYQINFQFFPLTKTGDENRRTP